MLVNRCWGLGGASRLGTTLRLQQQQLQSSRAREEFLKTIYFSHILVKLSGGLGSNKTSGQVCSAGCQARREKVMPHAHIRSHAFSPTTPEFETAGVKGERKMNGANSDFYKVSGAGR